MGETGTSDSSLITSKHQYFLDIFQTPNVPTNTPSMEEHSGQKISLCLNLPESFGNVTVATSHVTNDTNRKTLVISVTIPSKRDSSLKKSKLQLETTQEKPHFVHEGNEHTVVQVKFKEVARRTINAGRKRNNDNQGDSEEEGANGNRPISPTSPRYSPVD